MLNERWLTSLSYAGPLQPLIPENSPLKIFDRVFAGVMPDAGADIARLQQRLLDQKSTIDFVVGDLAALRYPNRAVAVQWPTIRSSCG